MAGFGEKLHDARKEKGLSLETVEDETKIRKLYLEALEKEAFTLLPARVYAVGFVKRYAQFLDLNVEELSREFKELAYQNEEEETPVKPVPVENNSRLSKIPVRNLFAAIAFLFVAIWAGNFLIDYIGNSIDKLDISKTPSVNENKNNLPLQNPTSNEKPASKTLDMVVKVKPGQKCWILVQVDGEKVLEKTLVSDQQQSFTAKKTIYIKAGNAGAIDITLNDKKLAPFGASGEIKEKEFKYGSKY